MAGKYAELRAKMSPAARARSEAQYARLKKEMPLHELREARQITQEQLAAALNVGQAAVSRMERRADVYVSTLRSVVKAMGGRLEINAVFPEGKVEIKSFSASGAE
jgi:DNA-binding XRE family transcriptional regulator